MASQICLSTAEALFLWPERYSMYAAHQGMVLRICSSFPDQLKDLFLFRYFIPLNGFVTYNYIRQRSRLQIKDKISLVSLIASL